MKTKNPNQGRHRARSLFSSLTLASVIVFSLGGCSEKSADEVTPKAKDGSSKADVTLVTHIVKVWIPANQGITHVNLRNDFNKQVFCVPVYGSGFWLDTGFPAIESYRNTITLETGEQCGSRVGIWGIIMVTSPRRDGLTYWWVRVPRL